MTKDLPRKVERRRDRMIDQRSDKAPELAAPKPKLSKQRELPAAQPRDKKKRVKEPEKVKKRKKSPPQ